jgi:FkbM family methyltransferase
MVKAGTLLEHSSPHSPGGRLGLPGDRMLLKHSTAGMPGILGAGESYRSRMARLVTKKFSFASRQILTLSIRGFLPPIHHHWFFRSLAADLFAEAGLPMWGSSSRIHIPQELFPVYLDYMDLLDHEPVTRRVLAGLLRPDSVFIDVGANVGYYTLLASGMVGSRGRVHAVECSSKNLVLLTDNVRKNNLQNVEIHAFAAASARGSVTLNVSPVGLAWFPPSPRWPIVPGRGSAVSVRAVPLDEIIRSPIDVVKIDTDGADLDVLKGMKRILSENEHVSVIVEWSPPTLSDAGKDPLELPRWLQRSGFRKISVLDQYYRKRRSLDEALEMMRAGKLPAGWFSDLFAQKAA